jgi:hypothetical protein
MAFGSITPAVDAVRGVLFTEIRKVHGVGL